MEHMAATHHVREAMPLVSGFGLVRSDEGRGFEMSGLRSDRIGAALTGTRNALGDGEKWPPGEGVGREGLGETALPSTNGLGNAMKKIVSITIFPAVC
jgi:hypothetical protein